MADLKKTIEIVFGGKDELSKALDGIDNSVAGFANSVESTTQPLADLASNILKVELAIGAMGAAALLYANSKASEMSGAQASLNKVMGESEGIASDYADEIKQLSLDFGVAGTATTDSAADFKQAGFTIEESLELVKVALTGVNIAELSSAESSELLKKNLAGLGAEASDAVQYMDAWNAVSNEFNATAKELAKATGLLAPSANSAGLSFNELVGLVTPLIEKFGSGSEAANALKVSLASLISDNKKVTDALDALGVSQNDVNGNLKQSGDIIKELGAKWPELTESQKANYGILLFGKERYVQMNAVLDDYETVLKATEVAINSQGSAQAELEVALQKSSFAANQFKVAFDFAAAAVGGQFLDNSTGVIKSLTALTTSFEDVVNDGGLKPLFDFLNPLLDEFANNIDVIAKNLPAAFKGVDFTGLIKSFKEVGFEINELFDYDLSTVEGLEEAIQDIIDVLASLNNIFAGVVEGFAPVIEVFKKVADETGEADDSTAKFIGNVLGYGATINTFAGWIGSLSGVFSALTDAVIILVGAKALGVLPDGLGKAGTAAKSLTSSLGKAGLWGALYSVTLQLATMYGETDLVRGALGKVFDVLDKLVGGPLSSSAKLMEEQNKASKEVAESSSQHAEAVEEVADAHVKAYEEATKYDDEVNELAQSTEEAALVNEQMAKGQEKLADQMKKLGLNAEGTKSSIAETGQAVKVTSGEFEGWYKIMQDGVEVFFQTKTAAENAAKGIEKTAEAEKKVAEESEKARIEAEKLILEYEKLQVELEKIASNEKIKTMELFVELETSKLEADAKKVVAAFESIGESYAATTDLIGELYGNLNNDLSFSQQWDLEDSIENAEKLQREQWEVQKELLEAQIKQTEAQTEKLQKGDALIKVDGGELQPELYAFMQAIFKSIKIEMNTSFEAYLLGLNT